MSTSPSKRLNPTLLIVVGVLVFAAVGFVVMKEPGPGSEEKEAAGKQSRKSSRTSGGPSSSDGPALHGTKSEEVRDGSRPEANAVPSLAGGVEELCTRISQDARTELRQLRDRYATIYDDPEERRAFGEALGKITDQAERQRVVRERTDLMRQARVKADATKTPEDRQREQRLIVLMQVENLWRMSEFVGQDPALRAEVEAFNNRLGEWAQGVDQMSVESFHSSFNVLRNTVNDMRRRHSELHPEPVPGNLPSNPPPQN